MRACTLPRTCGATRGYTAKTVRPVPGTGFKLQSSRRFPLSQAALATTSFPAHSCVDDFLDTACDLCTLVEDAECALDEVEHMLASMKELGHSPAQFIRPDGMEFSDAISAALANVEMGLAYAEHKRSVLQAISTSIEAEAHTVSIPFPELCAVAR